MYYLQLFLSASLRVLRARNNGNVKKLQFRKNVLVAFHEKRIVCLWKLILNNNSRGRLMKRSRMSIARLQFKFDGKGFNFNKQCSLSNANFNTFEVSKTIAFGNECIWFYWSGNFMFFKIMKCNTKLNIDL